MSTLATIFLNPLYLAAAVLLTAFGCMLLAHFSRMNAKASASRLEAEQTYISLFENNPDGVYAVDLNGLFTNMNKQAEMITGYRSEELLGTHFTDSFPDSQQEAVCHYFNRVLEGKPAAFETAFVHRDGTSLDILLTVLPIVVNGKQTGAYGIAKNISESKQAQQTAVHLAYHDELTGLPNRRSFQEQVESRLAGPQPGNEPFAIFFLDLDRFKPINDLFGHNFGDRILQEVATKLTRCIPPMCKAARMGGDEFTVFIPKFTSRQELSRVAAEIIKEFASPFEIEQHTFKLSISIGISVFPDDGATADLLMTRADAAMYEAKGNGSNLVRFYEYAMDKTDLERIVLENGLQLAIERDELILHYQPKVDTRTSECIGLEALVRWQHPALGMILPAKIIPLAEELGLIVPLEQWVLRAVCRQIKIWQSQHIEIVPVAVNLSHLHLMQRDIFDSMMRIIAEAGIDPHLLELEVTESAIMHNEEHAIRALNKFQQAGLAVSMDDFGTGYSSLGYLDSLPIDSLKIDRSFIRNITSKSGSRAIVEMILLLARKLDIKIIAEGAETEEQVKLLEELQCHQIQGYFFSRPVPPEQIRPMLKQMGSDQYRIEYDAV
jgi:diguanylate cyclase (GGDEF)-like protein/PAS domain S-box-containing protein